MNKNSIVFQNSIVSNRITIPAHSLGHTNNIALVCMDSKEDLLTGKNLIERFYETSYYYFRMTSVKTESYTIMFNVYYAYKSKEPIAKIFFDSKRQTADLYLIFCKSLKKITIERIYDAVNYANDYGQNKVIVVENLC